ncbi:MAG: OmpA family protein [FCB group bacterium]|jgi:outer membrane protein OmpA-like peptidoglycan-associated protein
MKFLLYIYVLFSLYVQIVFGQDKSYEPQNLGKAINTEYEERNPVISPDGKTLYFVRQGSPENIGEKFSKTNQDIWYAEIHPNGLWSSAKNIGPPLNNSNNNAVMSVTPDGNTLLLFGTYDTTGSPSGVSVSHRIAKGWSYPEKLIIKDFVNTSNWYQFYMSNDGKTLLMAIQAPDSYGMNDIYVSFLNDDGTWTTPKNLGQDINTDRNEITPFLAADGVTLYFSTNGIEGYGDYDVYLSRRLDDSWEKWSKPENLGPDITTDGFDAYYKIDAAGDFAYFTSTKNSIGLGDIYRIRIPKAGKPLPVALISGKVLNAITKKPIEAQVIYETLPEGYEAGLAHSAPVTGEYKITLPAGSKYGFRAVAEGYLSINDFIDLTHHKKYKEIKRNLELVPLETGSVIRINNIFFDYNLSELKEESFPELNRIIKFLNNNPNVEIEIAGHTDNVGSSAFNIKLSEDRAKAVADYFFKNNVNQKRVKYKGYGESKPIASNDTEEGKQLNRRVEFKIITK